MQSETKYTKQDLETMRAWSLQRKIQVTQTRIIEWIGRYDWNVYISFSGGKDSTVLADLTARAYQAFWCPNRKEPLHLVFVNTGLEYPEIQKFVKYFAKWLERQYTLCASVRRDRGRKYAVADVRRGVPAEIDYDGLRQNRLYVLYVRDYERQGAEQVPAHEADTPGAVQILHIRRAL